MQSQKQFQQSYREEDQGRYDYLETVSGCCHGGIQVSHRQGMLDFRKQTQLGRAKTASDLVAVLRSLDAGWHPTATPHNELTVQILTGCTSQKCTERVLLKRHRLGLVHAGSEARLNSPGRCGSFPQHCKEPSLFCSCAPAAPIPKKMS